MAAIEALTATQFVQNDIEFNACSMRTNNQQQLQFVIAIPCPCLGFIWDKFAIVGVAGVWMQTDKLQQSQCATIKRRTEQEHCHHLHLSGQRQQQQTPPI